MSLARQEISNPKEPFRQLDQHTNIPWKKRSDLVVNLSRERGLSNYVVKDPISLQYFSLSPIEFFILQCLDGESSLHSIATRTHTKFPEQHFTDDEIKAFLSTLIGSNLLTCTRLGYGQILAKKHAQKQNLGLRWISKFNILTLRWRGVDPNSFLKWLDSYLGWIFSVPALLVLCLLMATACLSFALHASSGGLNGLQLQSVLTFQNIPLLLIAILLVKVVHEFGHGLACVHYGGECHEMGLLFIAFCPLPYCDTTDSWLHESRWNRAFVASAGIIVEVAIASICCILWTMSIPGIFHLLLFNVMLICSVNTLLVNGNPLLRYDGYYVLSDVLNYPNLGPESRQIALKWFDRLVYGIRLNQSLSFSLRRVPLALFGAASGIYRIFVMAMILWAVHQILKSYSLESLTVLIAFPMVATFVFSLVAGLIIRGKMFAQSQGSESRLRAVSGIALFLGSILCLVSIPLPYTVNAPFLYEPGTCKPVYVSVPGRLVEIQEPYALVNKNETLARLENSRVRFTVEKTIAELALRELHLENLQKFQSFSTSARSAIPAAKDSLMIAKERYEAENLRMSRLDILSPATGTLYPSRNMPAQYNPEQKFRFWQNSILDETNLSAWLTEQTLIGWVGEASDFQAVIYIPQEQMAYIRANAETTMVFMSASNHECLGEITELGSERVQQIPRELVKNNLLAVNPALGQFHPSETLYRVRVSLKSGNAGPLYSTGIAKIQCRPVSLFSRFWRAVSHAFALEI